MQLMWLSGPTSRVKKISITARNILLAALGLAAKNPRLPRVPAFAAGFDAVAPAADFAAAAALLLLLLT